MLSGKEAKKAATLFALDEKEEELDMYIKYWQFDRKPRCFTSNSTLILLNKMKHDTYQKNPHIITYIYTKRDHRRRGEATRLIRQMKFAHVDATVYCSNNDAINLFERVKFVHNGCKTFSGFPAYRFPE